MSGVLGWTMVALGIGVVTFRRRAVVRSQHGCRGQACFAIGFRRVKVPAPEEPSQIGIEGVKVIVGTGDEHQLFDPAMREDRPQHHRRGQPFREGVLPEQLQVLNSAGREVFFRGLITRKARIGGGTKPIRRSQGYCKCKR